MRIATGNREQVISRTPRAGRRTNESHQKDGMEEFRALAEFYRILVEEAGRSSALLHEIRQRRLATRDGDASWTRKAVAVRGESG